MILGVDPGVRVTGFGVITVSNRQLRMISCGVIRSSPAKSAPMAARLYELFVGLCRVIEQFSPDVVAIENIFVHINPRSALFLGQSRGALMCAAVSQQKTVYEYTALQIKKSVVGYGHAQKNQVRYMMQQLLQLPALPGTDAADALACAVCHAYHASCDA